VDRGDLGFLLAKATQRWNELLQERIAALREDWMAQLRARTYVDIRVGGGTQ